ncbi:hypothetical protein [Flavobacterium psychrophilum]|uniref:hypothetical protein n=1 Tax=Flavobacterium psychrophilum TaxID=96345 RepID=UPI000B7C12EE|nr:hypothetical protein [Flavobacterium psychrophilum]EKT4502341.1 hypothetical protein [Flavobacterium psychrophilum]MBF2025125.1 hypothetical protein [Flavobacterium psychrophilum]MCB5984088.1 hypothetical protein [Flavobacterium psychrophilum]MCB5995503.1 hypothetical protein [Flavobacterium psychrophilum]MCB5997919.1 hypothetical protein [Flavobacterium psychrophilum]
MEALTEKKSVWNKICCIFVKLKNTIMNKLRTIIIKTTKKEVYRTPEIGSGLVRIAHKISSVSSQTQLVKIGERYFRVRELG